MQVAKRFKPPTVYWPDRYIITLNKTLNNNQSPKPRRIVPCFAPGALAAQSAPDALTAPGAQGANPVRS